MYEVGGRGSSIVCMRWDRGEAVLCVEEVGGEQYCVYGVYEYCV